MKVNITKESNFEDLSSLADNIELDVDNLIEDLQFELLLQKIVEDLNISNITIDYHSFSTARKTLIFSKILESELCNNRQLVLNFIELIKSYNNFSDLFFSSKYILFNDIEEFLDIKLALMPKLQEFVDKFASFYISMLLLLGKDIPMFLQKTIDIPKLLYVLFENLDLYTIAGICEKAKKDKIQVYDAYISGAKAVVSDLFDKWKVANSLFSSMIALNK